MQILPRPEDQVFIAFRDIGKQFVGGPMMRVFPDNVRQRNHQRHRRAIPRPRRQQYFALWRNHHRREKRQQKKQHGVFAFQRQPAKQSEQQPQSRTLSRKNPRRHPGARRPPQHHEHVGIQIASEILRRDQYTKAGEKLRISAAAHRARRKSRKQHLRGSEKHRHESNREKSLAEDFL